MIIDDDTHNHTLTWNFISFATILKCKSGFYGFLKSLVIFNLYFSSGLKIWNFLQFWSVQKLKCKKFIKPIFFKQTYNL
jgi:hypothetical protein